MSHDTFDDIGQPVLAGLVKDPPQTIRGYGIIGCRITARAALAEGEDWSNFRAGGPRSPAEVR
jgi:hypothetical protein